MRNVTVKDIAEAVGGKILCGNPQMPIENIAIDSRTMKGRDIFVPIIGAKVDAHRFIEGAFRAGAAATFTSEHEAAEDPDHAWIRVEDTVRALQDLGAWYRGRMDLPVIGITGSVGKTTTRELVVAALSSEKTVTGTEGNSNGQLGVPLTICEMDPGADIAVLEMGMSEPGEMERIARIARPAAGIVTNIGVSHIENLGSRENICTEKMHIADGFTGENTMILNGDEPLLCRYRGTEQFRCVFYGMGEENDYRAENIHSEGGRTVFTAVCGGRRMEISLGIPGNHNVMNALAALAAADAAGVSWEGAAGGLAAFSGFARRLQVIRREDYTYIDDTYNASPDSMKAALQVLSDTETGGQRLAVLADMLELGPDSPRFHYETGVYGRSRKIDQVFVIGELAANIGRAYEEAGIRVTYCRDNADAVLKVREARHPGDVILLKGSNGMHLGEVMKGLTQ